MTVNKKHNPVVNRSVAKRILIDEGGVSGVSPEAWELIDRKIRWALLLIAADVPRKRRIRPVDVELALSRIRPPAKFTDEEHIDGETAALLQTARPNRRRGQS